MYSVKGKPKLTICSLGLNNHNTLQNLGYKYDLSNIESEESIKYILSYLRIGSLENIFPDKDNYNF